MESDAITRTESASGEDGGEDGGHWVSFGRADNETKPYRNGPENGKTFGPMFADTLYGGRGHFQPF
jgi:hypothetical protein